MGDSAQKFIEQAELLGYLRGGLLTEGGRAYAIARAVEKRVLGLPAEIHIAMRYHEGRGEFGKAAELADRLGESERATTYRKLEALLG